MFRPYRLWGEGVRIYMYDNVPHVGRYLVRAGGGKRRVGYKRTKGGRGVDVGPVADARLVGAMEGCGRRLGGGDKKWEGSWIAGDADESEGCLFTFRCSNHNNIHVISI